jgi:4'-phosphopantetheinyl transferase
VTARVEVVLVDLRGDDDLPAARRRSLRTRAVLLAELGTSQDALARTGTGKPYLPGSRVCFNVSHAHELGAVALADVDVGVDVEALAGPRRRRVLPGVLSPSELARVQAGAEPVAEFLRCWTRKEALLKAIGCGVGADLAAVSIDPDRGALRATTLPPALGDPAAWAIADLALDDAYAGAVAARAGGIEISVR